MKSVLFINTLAAMVFAATTTAGFGFNIAVAQMADNATLGNMTGGNMTMGGGNLTDNGNSTDAVGSISGAEDPFPPG